MTGHGATSAAPAAVGGESRGPGIGTRHDVAHDVVPGVARGVERTDELARVEAATAAHACPPVEQRGPAQACERAQRVVGEDRRRLGDRREGAADDHGDPVGDRRDEREVVRDDDHRTARVGALPQDAGDRGGLGPVQPERGLVGEEDRRVQDGRCRQGQAPLLAAREPVRVRVGEAREPERGERPGDARVDVVEAGEPRRPGDLLAHRAGDELVLGVLEHHRDGTAGCGRHLARGALEPGQAAQERRLAAPVGPDDGEHLARADVEVHVAHDGRAAVPGPPRAGSAPVDGEATGPERHGARRAGRGHGRVRGRGARGRGPHEVGQPVVGLGRAERPRGARLLEADGERQPAPQPGEVVRVLAQDAVGGAVRDDPAVAPEHQGRVRQRAQVVQAVLDEHDRAVPQRGVVTVAGPGAAREAGDEGPDVVGGRGVQQRGGLVEDEELRLGDERRGDRDALGLAARQRVGRAVVQVRGADGGERRGRAGVHAAGVGTAVLEREPQLLVHARQAELVAGPLLDEADAGGERGRRHLARVGAGHAEAAQDDAREGVRDDADERAQEGRLPAPGRAEDQQARPGRDGDVDAVEHPGAMVPEVHGHVGGCDSVGNVARVRGHVSHVRGRLTHGGPRRSRTRRGRPCGRARRRGGGPRGRTARRTTRPGSRAGASRSPDRASRSARR